MIKRISNVRDRALSRLTRGIGQRHPFSRRSHRWFRPARFGNLRRTVPLSSDWGFERGTPLDRYYIETFLGENSSAIHGTVLEILNRDYTERFGSDVTRSDVLDIDETNPHATIIADLSSADHLPSDVYDCFILTQTLQLIPDVSASVHHAHRMLRPGGTLLATIPSISRIIPEYGLDADYWRFTPASCHHLFDKVFGQENVEIRTHGNVLTATSFLMGISAEELTDTELEENDPYFPLIMSVRAVKR